MVLTLYPSYDVQTELRIAGQEKKGQVVCCGKMDVTCNS